MSSYKNALVLIPCCKDKMVIPCREILILPFENLEMARGQLLALVGQTPEIASKLRNERGILNPNAPLTLAVDLYVGRFYRSLGGNLRNVLMGRFSNIHVLIVSAMYGLVQLGESIREYELQMGDRLVDGMPIYQFWQRQELWRLLHFYVSKNDVSYVWSLLPNSMPSYPYHQVFTTYWDSLRTQKRIRCYHVKVFKDSGQSAGTGSGTKRGEWLNEVLNTGPNYLVGEPLPPRQFAGIPGFVFDYYSC